MLDLKTRLTTREEYLAMERASEYRHEYSQGEVTEMTGASREHNLLVSSISARLYMQLLGQPCEIYTSDMRVKVTEAGLYTYPDLVVVCDEPDLEDAHVDTLLNPNVIIEVLSNSTEEYDRGKKFAHYRKLPSLTDYLLVAQDRMHVEQFARQPNDTWLFSEADHADVTITIASIGCELQLEEIYEKVNLPEADLDETER